MEELLNVHAEVLRVVDSEAAWRATGLRSDRLGSVAPGRNPPELLFVFHPDELAHHPGDQLGDRPIDVIVVEVDIQSLLEILHHRLVVETVFEELMDRARSTPGESREFVNPVGQYHQRSRNR